MLNSSVFGMFLKRFVLPELVKLFNYANSDTGICKKMCCFECECRKICVSVFEEAEADCMPHNLLFHLLF